MQKLSLGRKAAPCLDSRNAPPSCQGPQGSAPPAESAACSSPATPSPVFSTRRRQKTSAMKSKPHIAVIGAGAFGGWTALHLLERGARVTLLDAWGPGNSRASSGGETRIMRGTYGPDQPYSNLAARALRLWKKYERRWKSHFLHRTGVLWMVSSRDDSFERGSLDMLRQARIKFQEHSTP